MLISGKLLKKKLIKLMLSDKLIKNILISDKIIKINADEE